ncbi:MAG: glucans biosynthesis glucosyltransferase MdoH [Desulfuromonadaceae bacterium]|nr:glucans biosynthesis glucosyltransferase MdoH [Desulfuromonadaceae bacterium]
MPPENHLSTAIPEKDLERTGRRLLLYLRSLPLPESARLETAATVLRDLQENPPPFETTAEAEAMRRLRLHLGEKSKPAHPPAAGPPLCRGHMMPEEMDRRPWWTATTRLLQRIKKRLGLPESRPDHLAELPQPRIGREYFNEPWCRIASYRRIVLAILVIVPALLAGPVFATLLPHKGNSFLEMALVIVFALLFAWISVGFWTAMLGFITLFRRFDRMILTRSSSDKKSPTIRANVRTAILFPVCNEEMSRVCAGIAATARSLERTGQNRAFDLFILSDTADPDAWVEEEIAWRNLSRELAPAIAIFYRNRRINLKRKSGNVADFCRRYGRHYTYMVVMDADSVMSGETLVHMVTVMERQRRVGILQSAPAVAGRETLLARVQQFCSRAYGPMFAAGLHSMQLGDAQFWGHNAIIRVKPFMHHCGLPRLPGKPPLGGDILSHDFVESALMRRAGWGVWLGYDLSGSYEETPPTLLAELKRDRRWCTGNLQHLRLVFTRGLFPTHRVLFLNGAMSYISAFLWFLLLLLSTIEAILIAITEPVYFPATRSLFPNWPVWDPYWPLVLLGATAVLLFLPKLFSAFLILVKGKLKEFGGFFALSGSILFEVVISTLLAPIRMLFHTKFVFFILLGRQSGWGSQQRDDLGTSWWEALRFHGAGTLFAILWGGSLYLLNPAFLLWISPIIGSLLFSVPISVWTSRASLGRFFRKMGLFLTPEEIAPPRELQELASSEKHFAQLSSPLGLPRGMGFAKAVLDPAVHALHISLLMRRPHPPSSEIRQRRLNLMQKALDDGPDQLSAGDKRRLLYDVEILTELHRRLWEKPEEDLKQKWGLARL